MEQITSALRARDFDRAIQLMRAALKLTPNNAQLWSLQGIAFASKGENKSAFQAFQQALKISPDYIAALAGAAQIHYQAGDMKAIPLLNRLFAAAAGGAYEPCHAGRAQIQAGTLCGCGQPF